MDQTPQNQSAQTVPRRPRRVETSIARLRAKVIRTNPLDDANWTHWRMKMTPILTMCGVKGYVEGQIQCPDPTVDPDGANNWAFNDNYAKHLIGMNIGPTQVVHVSRCATAHEMWRNLKDVHQPMDSRTIMSYLRGLRYTTADDGDDIFEHLNKLKTYWDRINSGDFKFEIISELHFKVIIANSLPLSWDAFIEPYVERFVDDGPKKAIRSQELIGILRAEYVRREERRREVTQQTSLKAKSTVRTPKPSLTNQVTHLNTCPKPTSINMFCEHCRRRNHHTEDCFHLGKNKCSLCGKFGHEGACRTRKAEKGWENGKKRLRAEVSGEEEEVIIC